MVMVAIVDADASQTRATLGIDFLFLDQTTCARRLGADHRLESARVPDGPE